MTPVEVSVVIPTRDRWHRLSRCALPSALAQEDVAFEVIVVDDGSTDETPARLAEAQDSRLRVLRHDSPRGVAAARNTGIEAAYGEWLALLDDDDLWSPRKLRVQLDAAWSEGASFVYGAALVLDEPDVPYAIQPPDASKLASQLLTTYSIPAGASNVMVRTDLLRRLGGFDEQVSYLADWDMWLRLAWGGRGVACPELLVGYVRHRQRMLPSWRDVLRELDYFVGKHGGAGLEIHRAGFLLWVAFEHRRAGRRLGAASIYLRIALTYRRPRHLLDASVTLLDGPVGDLLRYLLRRRVHRPEPRVAVPAWLERYR